MSRLDPGAEGLEAVPENHQVLANLRQSAEPASSEYRLGAFELHTHPDVCERLDQVARDSRSVGVYGCCGRATRGGVLYAIARGTTTIALRLPDGPVREAVLAHGGRLAPELGIDWVAADVWLSEVPRAGGTALLVAWVEAARLAADA